MDVDSDGSDEDDDEDNSDLENAYLGKLRPKKPVTAPSPDSEDEDAEDAGDDSASNNSDAEDSDADAPPPVHESLTKRVRTKPTKKTKIVPENETPVQRDARTLFVGGLPAEVAQKRVCTPIPRSSMLQTDNLLNLNPCFPFVAAEKTTDPAHPLLPPLNLLESEN
jgi:hypothetical protein